MSEFDGMILVGFLAVLWTIGSFWLGVQLGKMIAREEEPVDPEEEHRRFFGVPKLDAQGRFCEGVWQGMTPAEVLAERDEYNRACGE